jgi:hypothetical protein
MRICWPLRNSRPRVQARLVNLPQTRTVMRELLADTGAGSGYSLYELILSEDDCYQFGSRQGRNVNLGGAYTGVFPLYLVRIVIVALGFDRRVLTVPVPAMQLPIGFDGLAAFSFLNRFTYGNFGHSDQFCLET